ncbi:MAG: tetratricopeptide repeat-containing serine protease family protein [Alphaproteobacteria bacterium]
MWGAVPTHAFEQEIDDIQSEQLEVATKTYQFGDYDLALEFFKPLADEGVAEAQFYYGFMHAQGLGVLQNYEIAAEWYLEAARQGHPLSQNYLGLLYYEGNGLDRSFREAFLYFELAAAAGNEDAANNRLIVARKMTSAQITEAQKAAGAIIVALRARVKRVLLPRRLASGLAIGSEGLIFTHAEAAVACREMTVRLEGQDPLTAELVTADRFNGLALISTGSAIAEPLLLRQTPITAGERVTVVGFGLDEKKNLIVETTDTRVTSDPALHRVDQRYFQVSTVVSSSLLGAAVIDRVGRVIGIMVPNIEPDDVAQLRGEPERVSFVLRHELIHLLLEINGHAYDTAASEGVVASEQAVAAARAATVAIECWREDEKWPEESERTADTGISTSGNTSPSGAKPTGQMRRRRSSRHAGNCATCDAAWANRPASYRCSTRSAGRSRRARFEAA